MISHKQSNIAGLLLAVATLPTLPGCVKPDPSPEVGSVASRLSDTEREYSKASRLGAVKDVGNGVFVFPRDQYFPETLSDFLGENKDRYELMSVTQGADISTGAVTNDWRDSRANSMVVVVRELEVVR
jgi:hypothetical protein